jgi:hypothetical protein
MTPFVSAPLSEQQALQILSERLHSFEEFAGKPFAQAINEEAEWQGTTESLVIRIFGFASSQQSNSSAIRIDGVCSTGWRPGGWPTLFSLISTNHK